MNEFPFTAATGATTHVVMLSEAVAVAKQRQLRSRSIPTQTHLYASSRFRHIHTIVIP